MGKPKTRQISIACVVLAAAGIFALYFAGMGSYPLVDPDEPVYGQVAKEMASGAGWLTPHFDGKMWFDKPPLFYWLSGLSAKLLGPTELACRLPSAVLAVAVLFLLYFLVKHDFGKRAALFASVAMATCLQMIVLARASVTDMTLLFCLLGALYAYRRWFDAAESRDHSLRWMALCGAMTGLGMLAKGPVAPLLLFVTFCIHLWRSGRLRHLVSFDALAGIAAALIVGFPWFVAMYVLHHDAFVHQFIEVNNIARFAKPEHSATTGGWYSIFLNIPVLFVFFFPWSVFLPSGLLRLGGANDGARLAGVWFWVVFVFFSISKTQLVTYIFPLYPAAALFVGVLLDKAASGELGCAKAVKKSLIAVLVYSALLAVALVELGHMKYPGATVGVSCMGGAIVLAGVVSLLGRQSRAVWVIGTGMAVFTLLLMFAVVPSITSAVSTRDIVRTIPRVSDGRVVNYGLSKPSLLFYLGRNPERFDDIAVAKRLLSEKVSTWVICKDKDVPLLRVAGSVETARSGGLAIVANESAANRKGSSPN